MIDFTEAYESMIDNCMLEELDYEAATEGANNDARKLKKSYSKEIRSLAKEAKKNYKHGNYAEAKTMYTKCASLAKEMAAEVKSIEQTLGQVQIGNLLHSLKTIASCLLVGSFYTGIKEEQKNIQQNIDKLNAAGNGELTRADMNKYTRDIIFKANAMAEKFSKLAAKAAKGEIEVAGATESFNYDEFMFACESLMDELEADLSIDSAMEADGAEDGEGNAPSTLANRVRGAFAKLRRAFKRGDKQEVEEAKKEADAAAKELADAAEAAPPEKKEKYKKAAKIAGASVAAVAATVGMTMAGTAIYQKAKGQDIDPTALFKIAGRVTSTAAQNVGKKVAGGAQAVANAPGNIINSKKDKAEVATRKADLIEGGVDAETFDKAVNKNMLRKVQDDRRSNNANAKKAAKKAAKAANEAFGISEYDAYEVIFEAMMSAEETDFESDDAELTASIEAIL